MIGLWIGETHQRYDQVGHTETGQQVSPQTHAAKKVYDHLLRAGRFLRCGCGIPLHVSRGRCLRNGNGYRAAGATTTRQRGDRGGDVARMRFFDPRVPQILLRRKLDLGGGVVTFVDEDVGVFCGVPGRDCVEPCAERGLRVEGGVLHFDLNRPRHAFPGAHVCLDAVRARLKSTPEQSFQAILYSTSIHATLSIVVSGGRGDETTALELKEIVWDLFSLYQ